MAYNAKTCVHLLLSLFLLLPPSSYFLASASGVDKKNIELNEQRALLVRGAVLHAWHGYLDFAHLADDLKPVSQSADKWLHARTTFYDSLDTLYIAGLDKEFNDAIDEIISHKWFHRWPSWTAWHHGVPTSVIYPVKTFEYHIRIVGGLLGAYMVSGKRELLHSAQYAMDCILIAFETPNNIPRPHTRIAHPTITPVLSWIARTLDYIRATYDNEVWSNTLAGLGSFGLELRVLSRETGDPKYRQYAEKIHQHIYEHWIHENENKRDGFQKKVWHIPRPMTLSEIFSYKLFGQSDYDRSNIDTDSSVNSSGAFYLDIGFGSGGDSYYEYLLKETLFEKSSSHALSTKPLLEMYQALTHSLHQGLVDADSSKSHATRISHDQQIVYLTDLNSESSSHLGCFAGGLLALGYNQLHQPLIDLTLAENITEHCVRAYLASPTGLGGERYTTNRMDGSIKISSGRNQLRPEVVESLFVLWSTTKHEKWRNYAWNIFENIEKHCKIKTGGYSGITDVRNDDNDLKHDDYQPSFFIAETLKYLYLIFDEDNEANKLSRFVFTTEAHPMTLAPRCEMEGLPVCSGSDKPSYFQTVPWDAVVLIHTLILILIVFIWKCCWYTSKIPKLESEMV
jgi:hypothetical protein